MRTFVVVEENEEKKKRLARAGQSLKQSLIMNQRIRASHRAYDKFKQKEMVEPNKMGTFRETYLPTFNIHSCDYLGLLATSFNRLLTQKNVNKIRDILAKNGEAAEIDQISYVFSDYIEKFDAKLNKYECITIITDKNLYIFSPKDMACKNIAQLKNLTQVLMVKQNDSLLGLKMADGKDLFIETVRRIELVVYLTTNSDMTGSPQPKIIQGSKINLSQKKHSQVVNFRSKNNLQLQRNFISLSPIFGYLMTLDIAEMLKKEEKEKKSWSLLKRSKKKTADEYKWEEKFYVLGSLGLIIMEKPNSEKVDFYPNNQFKVEMVPEVRYLRKNCFEITPRTS